VNGELRAAVFSWVAVKKAEQKRPFMNPDRNVEDIKGAVVVVGGGIAGMQAALDIASAGFYVYLVEKSPAIGGAMAQLDKTFPTNDCSM
jgi:heterodisulfide reductase subunit A-like polyferredoxin